MWGYFVLVITLPSFVVCQASHCYRCFGSSWCNNFTDPAFGSNVDIVECPTTTNLDYKGDNLFTESLLNSLRDVAEATSGADTYDGSLVGCVTATVHEAHEDHTVRVCMGQASIICPSIRNAVLSAVNDISPDVRFSCEGCTEGLCNTHTFVENNVSSTPSPTESSSPTSSSSNTPSTSTTETSPPTSESSPISSPSSSTTSEASPTSESTSSSTTPSSSTTETSPPTSEYSSSSTTSSSTTSEASTSASESSPISSTSSSTTREASPATSSSQSSSSSTESSPATTESPPNSNQTSTSTTSEPSPTPDEVPLTTTNESELDEDATKPSPGAGHTVAISHIIALFVLILDIWVM